MSLDRFIKAQNGVYSQALAELREGRKKGHWMWFVFPQLKGLGGSATARHFAITGLDEALDYVDHPLLGARLVTCAKALLRHRETPIAEILGEVDTLKLRSSMTLFAAMPGADPVFQEVLDAFYDQPCPHTMRMLDNWRAA